MSKRARLFFASVLVLLALLVLPSLWQKRSGTEILVSAAISLKDVLIQIGDDFAKQHPDIKLSFNFAASGLLKTQIENGAPADIFISASAAEMEALEKKSLLLPASRMNLVKNSLVFVKNKNSRLTISRLEELIQCTDLKIAIGNPLTVPVGRYAQQTLEFYQMWKTMQKRLIFAENARQVLDYVARGEVDVGFVYRTDAIHESRVETLLSIPAQAHEEIVYPMAIIRSSSCVSAARLLARFMANERRAVWQQFAFQCD